MAAPSKPPKRPCKAKNAQGEPCGRAAIRGGSVCHTHGGGAPQVRRAADERLAVEMVNARFLADLDRATPMRSIGEVYDELLAVAGQVRAWRQVMTRLVSELGPDGVGYESKTGEQIKAEVTLYERALDRSARVAELVARLNLDQRKAALDERTGEAVAHVIHGILEDLGLSEEQQARVSEVVPKHLRKLVV